MGSEARARLALLGLLVVTVISFSQVFARGHYRGPALLGMAAAFGIALAARRLGAGTLLTIAASISGLVWYLVVIFEPGKAFYTLPTPDALAGLAGSVERAYARSSVDYAPVPVRSGYVIMVVAGVWAAAALGELAAFRWRRPLLASVLPLTIFAINLVVGTGQSAGLLVALYVAALLTFWGVESAHRMRSWGRWIPVWSHHPAEAPSSITGRIARRMGASCVAAALVAPLFLPALGEGLLTWRSGGSSEGGVGGGRIDPLVSIVPDLLQQTNKDLFTVQATEPAYWALYTLREFDGESWAPVGNVNATVPAEVISGVEGFVEGRRVEQRFVIQGLEGPALPAAAVPTRVTIEQPEERPQDHALASLLTGDLGIEGGVEQGLVYSVTSEVPDATYRELKRAEPGGLPFEYDHDYTELPHDAVGPEVARLLGRWTRGEKTSYEKLLAIQRRLRDDTFVYDESVATSATSDHLTNFLTVTRRGYCQQFATAFAVLARELGYPTRVVVGFLPGETDIASPASYAVRGTDAHAWPEVYFGGHGWIRFEPTPRDDGREAVPAYVAPARAAGIAGGPPARRLGGRGNQFDVGGVPRPDGAPAGYLQNPFAAIDPQQRRDLEAAEWQRRFRRISLVVAVVALAYLLGVPAAKELRTRRRYRSARRPDEVAVAAFAEFQEEAEDLAAPRLGSESAMAYAARMAHLRGLPRKAAVRLADIYQAAEYAASGIPAGQAEEARRLARDLRRKLWSGASWWNRAVRLFSPTRLRVSLPRGSARAARALGASALWTARSPRA